MATNIVVVDDSGEGVIARELRSDFSTVTWVIHDRNEGFGETANEAVKRCPADVVILLNDDTELLNDPIPELERAFLDPDIFAVSFLSRLNDGRFREGAKRLIWSWGFPRILHNPADQFISESGDPMSAYAVGGHAAYRRAAFVELGGFDPLFAPFYWEDVDLSTRAIQFGFRIVFSKDCQVRHEGLSAIRSRHDVDYLKMITLRNRILFAWRHARGFRRCLLHCSIVFQYVFSLFSTDHRFIRSYQSAIQRRREFSTS